MKGAPPLFSKNAIRKSLAILFIILSTGIPVFQLIRIPARATDPTVSVTIYDYYFQPAKLNITTGTTVVWTYISTGHEYHTVSSRPGTNQTAGGAPLLNSGMLSPGQSFSYTFYNPGVYPYECQFHPTIMMGSVNATGSPVSPPSSQAPTTDYTLVAIIGGLIVAVAGTAAVVIVARKRKKPVPPTQQ